MAIFQVVVFQRFISVFSVYFISIISAIISIIFSISFPYNPTLHRYHTLIESLVVHELDVWS